LLHVRADVKRADAFLQIAEMKGDKIVRQQIAEKKKEAREFGQGKNIAPTQRPVKTQNQAVPMSKDEEREMHYIGGMAYLNGYKPPKDIEAVLSFAKAVELGHEAAQKELEKLILAGRGIHERTLKIALDILKNNQSVAASHQLKAAIAQQIQQRNVKEVLPVINAALDSEPELLVDILSRVKLTEAADAVEKILVTQYTQKGFLPPQWRDLLKSLADRGYPDAARIFAAILRQEQENKFPLDKWIHSVTEGNPDHYDRIAQPRQAPKLAEEDEDEKL
jgi:hypothetical protein